MKSQLNISDLESISGVKAHTIRIWEKRYGFLTPHRTDTNIRFYDSAHLKKLLNAKTLLEHGEKISNISKFTEDELLNALENATSQGPIESCYSAFLNKLVIAMISLDEPSFDKTFNSSVLKLGLEETMEQVIYPFMLKIGVLWTVNKLNPGQEHFASNLVRQKLFAAIDGMTVSPKRNPSNFLLFLPVDEDHDLGLLYSHYLIRKSGHHSIFLGGHVPLSCVFSSTKHLVIDYFVTSFTIGKKNTTLFPYLEELNSFSNVKKIIVAGNTSGQIDESKLPNLFFINSIQQLKKLL